MTYMERMGIVVKWLLDNKTGKYNLKRLIYHMINGIWNKYPYCCIWRFSINIFLGRSNYIRDGCRKVNCSVGFRHCNNFIKHHRYEDM